VRFLLANYQRIVTSALCDVLVNSVRIGTLTAFSPVWSAIPRAHIAFGLKSVRARFIAQLLVMLPWWAPICQGPMLEDDPRPKRISSILASMHLGVIASRSASALHEFSVVLTLTSSSRPRTLSSSTSLSEIPISLVEAASNFRRTKWEVFRRIIFPISLPILTGAIVAFALAFGDFIAPALLGGSHRS